jgi:enoyl-CoA hydratase/carnithine racemase
VLSRNAAEVVYGVVVFTGAGDKAFIAGADIAEFAGRTSITQRDVMMTRIGCLK